MSWSIEKEENGKSAIVIKFGEATALDPYSGFGRMFDVDLSVPGEVSVGYPITTSTLSGGGQSLGTPIADSTRWFGYGSSGYVPSGSPQSFAVLDGNGRVWESSSITGTWTFLSSSNSVSDSSLNDGVAYYLGYLFKTRGANIDYWNGSTWSQGWQTTLTSSTKHYMYVASNNVLYITNGNYLASVTPNSASSFDPSSSGTFTFNINKLQLPTSDVAISLAEVGQGGGATSSTLLIGGIMNAIYPWDKVSPSFGFPIYVGESYIRLMVSVNQNAFIFCGNQQGRGRIYVTNGSQAMVFFKMPDYVFGVQDPYYVWGDAIFHRNFLLFGCFVVNNAGTVLLFSEVFALNLDTKEFTSISNINAASEKSNATCLISTANLSSSGFGYILAWDDNSSSPGIGYSNTAAGTGTFNVYTDLIPVGTLLIPKTFSQIEVKLRTALQSGESLSIVPVADNVGQTTLTMNTVGTFSKVFTPLDFQASQWLQFQCLGTGASSTGGVRLHEIRIR